MISYTDFLDFAAHNLINYLPSEYQGWSIEVSHADKKPDRGYDGLLIRSDISNVGVSFDAHTYYDAMDNLGEMPSVLTCIAEDVIHALESRPEYLAELTGDKDFLRSNVIPEIMAYTGDESKFAGMPHEIIDDMVIIFRVIFEDMTGESMSTVVTDELLKLMDIPEDKLLEIAAENAQHIYPIEVRCISGQRAESKKYSTFLHKNEKTDELEDDDDYEFNFGIDDEIEEDNELMYIVRSRGAECLLYPGFIENIKSYVDSGFFVLPFSVHTLMVIKDPGDISNEFIRDIAFRLWMLERIESLRLTKKVYYYNEFSDEFGLLENTKGGDWRLRN